MGRDPFAEFAEDVRTCRECRQSGDPRSEAFAQAVQDSDRPPEIHDGPPHVDILIVSINPKLSPIIPRSKAEYYADERKTMNRARDRMDPYVRGVEDSLPTGYSWWNRDVRTVGNTRMCKCPTPDWNSSYNWAASRCADKFFSRELALLQPRVVLVLGVDTWKVVLPLLGIDGIPFGPGPHAVGTGLIRSPIVAAHHLSRKGARYREALRAELERAIQAEPTVGGAREPPRARSVRSASKRPRARPGRPVKRGQQWSARLRTASRRARAMLLAIIGGLTIVPVFVFRLQLASVVFVVAGLFLIIAGFRDSRDADHG